MTVYVAGVKGMLGRSLKSEYEQANFEVFGSSSEDVNFLDFESTIQDFKKFRPKLLIIAAAKVGGIGANLKYPVEYLAENIIIQTNILRAAHLAKIEKVVFIASSCIYPKHAPIPIKEESLMTGALEESNAPYSLAKLAGIKLTQSYRAEYGHDWISILPTNLYGPYDNFNLEKSHVLPSLMRKFQMATQENRQAVEIWGDGTPRREFLHVSDLASAIRIAADKYSSETPMNIGSQREYSIREVVDILKNVSNFCGEVLYDTTKPNGADRKQLDSSKILNLGWKPAIKLEQGLKETYEWLKQSLINGERIKL